MDRIIIYGTDASITMPRTKAITFGAKEESRKTMMVSGRIVKDIIGYRTVVTAAWDYLPASTVAELTRLLLQNSFVRVEYPSPTGAEIGWFDSDFPTMSVFAYKNGIAVWHNVVLKLTAKEVR